MNGLAIGRPVPDSLAEWDPLGCVGSSEAEVLAAYPGADVVDNGSAGLHRAYSVEGESGRLVIEVIFGDFGSEGPRDVWMMRLDPLDWKVRSLGGGDTGGFCALTV